jgi:type IV pilus assembly protein PilN
MIRVNLVEGGRQVEKRTGLALPVGQQLTLIGGLVLIVTALLIGWRYWGITAAEATLDAEIAAAQQQEEQLKGILQQVQTFETRRQQLQQRVALIDELRRGQAVPVHIIDQVSRALPDGMWLTRLTQTAAEITIEGDCLSLTSLSDFVGNLEGSRYFVRPVEIINSEVVAARDNLPEVIHFSVKGTFQMAGPSRPEGAQENAGPERAKENAGDTSG